MDDDLIREAGDLAEDQGLRAYDAIHLAAALRVDDLDGLDRRRTAQGSYATTLNY